MSGAYTQRELNAAQSVLKGMFSASDDRTPQLALDFIMKRLDAAQPAKSPTTAKPPQYDVLDTEAKHIYPAGLGERPLSITVLGASGDLASKKTFPALFSLFQEDLIPPTTAIVGYARSKLDIAVFHKKVVAYFPSTAPASEKQRFLSQVSYVAGTYDDSPSFDALHRHLCDHEQQAPGNRLFYLALPPTAFVGACAGIKARAMPKSEGWARVIVEKPFGSDTASSGVLSQQLSGLFTEQQLFRIDHYLGKEMVKNLTMMRFANHVFGSIWDRAHIANVQVTFKETIGTEGRGGYFDTFGIIRDVIQNHLTQVLSLVAMEKPRSLDPEVLRDEKVAVLKCVPPVKIEDCVLGQYTAPPNSSEKGYLEDPTVPKGSHTPTFAAMVLYVNNDRWAGVPFYVKAGKALESKTVVVRIQFREEVRPFESPPRNELVIRAQPGEAVYMKLNMKTPGMSQTMEQTELDLTYQERFDHLKLPDAYQSLIHSALLGDSTNFVRSDELEAAWRIYTPLLHDIDAGKVPLMPYTLGSRGPQEADELLKRCGYRRSEYHWKVPTPKKSQL